MHSSTHLEELCSTPIDTDTLALVQIRFVVLVGNALGMARVDETVENIGDHIQLCDRHLNLHRRMKGQLRPDRKISHLSLT
jgi:hypothetical protein